MPWNSICSSICESGPAQTLFHQKKPFFIKLKLFSLHPYHAQSKTLIFLPFPLKSNWLRFRLLSWVIPSGWLWSKQKLSNCKKNHRVVEQTRCLLQCILMILLILTKLILTTTEKKTKLELDEYLKSLSILFVLAVLRKQVVLFSSRYLQELVNKFTKGAYNVNKHQRQLSIKKRLHSEKISIIPKRL